MDSSLVIGILIGAVVVLAILAFRKGGSGASSSSGGPTVHRLDDPGVSVADKHAAKSAAVAKRSRPIRSKRVPIRASKQAEASVTRTGLNKHAAQSPGAPAVSNKSGKKTTKTTAAPAVTKDFPRKSSKKTTAPNKDVASGDVKDSTPRHMID